jgi:hypothetical protein
MSARARVVHHWADGGVTELSVTVDPTYPDAVDEARMQVVKLWRETCCTGEDAEAEGE